MAKIYIVLKAAKALEDDFLVITTERAFKSLDEAKKMFLPPFIWQQVIEGNQCQSERVFQEVKLNSESIIVVFRIDHNLFTEIGVVSGEQAFNSFEEATKFISDKQISWNERIENVECVCERLIHEVEL